MFASIAWAQAQTQSTAAAAGPSLLEQLAPFVFIFIIFYFLLIRPQAGRAKKHASFLQSLKKGDQVLTASGIFGTVAGLTDQFVTLEVAEDVNLRVLKTQIASAAYEEKKS